MNNSYSTQTIDKLKKFLIKKDDNDGHHWSIGVEEAYSDMLYATSLGSSAINVMLQAWLMMDAEEILASSVEIDYYMSCCEIQHELNNIVNN